MSKRPRSDSPYRGLVPYDEQDAPFFFGREAEREIITANLIASRLTVFYGASGVGKSSVLRAGVAYRLRALAQQNLRERGTPESIVVVFNAWRDDPIVGLASRVQETVTRTLNGQKIDPVPPSPPLAQMLQAWTQRVDSDLLIILDQFEEYFLYHQQEDGEGTFATEFPRAVIRSDLRVSFLLSIREDALAKLDRFKGRIPNLFDNYLRLEHLDLAAARDAIVKPIEQYNRLHPEETPVSIEPALIDAVLAQVKTGELVLGEAGRGAVKTDGSEVRIETPYLQLVMTRLWDEEMRVRSRILRLETLNRLGGAKEIVRHHLDVVMGTLNQSEQDIAAKGFRFLVTPSGTKIAYTVSDLSKIADLDEAQLASVMEKLASGDLRILRSVASAPGQPTVPRYEIFHDVLAAPILDWGARFAQVQAQSEAERKLASERRRVLRLRLALIGVSALLLATIALAFLALQQQRLAFSRELFASSIANLSADPERSILLAMQSLAIAKTEEGEDALRQALVTSLVRVRFQGHNAPVYSAEFSPYGNLVLTTGGDGKARIWDPVTGKEVERLDVENGTVLTAAFNHDGRRIITAGEDALVRLWDANTGQLLMTFANKHTGEIRSATFSPDDKQVVTASLDKTMRIWDSTTGDELGEIPAEKRPINQVGLSPDGKRVVTASSDGTAKIWNIEDPHTIEPVVTFNGHTLTTIGTPATIWSVAYSPDGKWVVSGATDAVARVWDATTGNEVFKLSGHTGPIYSVSFSPDGKQILTASTDGTARIWDVDNRTQLAVLRGHTGEIRQAAWNPDGHRVVTASFDQTARVWELQGGYEVGVLRGHQSRLWSAAYSPDGTKIVTAGGENNSQADNTARVWDTVIDQQLTVLSGHTRTVWSAVFSPDGKQILTASADGTARIWDAETGKELYRLSKQEFSINSAAYSRDGKQIVTTGDDSRVYVWDVATRQLLMTFRGHANVTTSGSFSPDGQRVVTSSWDKTVRVWDVATGNLLQQLPYENLVWSVAYSPDGKEIAAAGDYGNGQRAIIHVWGANSWQDLALLRQSPDRIYSVAFSHDSKLLVSASADDTAVIWDLASRQVASTLRGHSSFVISASFSPYDRYVVTAGDDHTARIYYTRVEDLMALARTRVTRELTCEERQVYLHEATCPTPTTIPTPPPTTTLTP